MMNIWYKNLFCLLFFALHMECIAQTPLLPYRDGNLWGFADENCRLVIPAVYDFIPFFEDSISGCCRLPYPYSFVSKGDSCWVIGTDGRPFFDGFKEQGHGDFSFLGDHLLYLNTMSGGYLTDRSLKLIRFLPDIRITRYSYWRMGLDDRSFQTEKMALFNGMYNPSKLCGKDFTQSPNSWNRSSMGKYLIVSNKKTGLSGLIDGQGKDILPIRYHKISNIWNGIAVADNTIIDSNGLVLHRSRLDLMNKISEEGLIYAKDTSTNRIGFVDTEGNTRIAPLFLRAYGFYKGLAFCQLGDSSWAIINTSGQKLMQVYRDTNIKKTSAYTRVNDCLVGVRIDQGLVWCDQYLFVRQSDHYWHCLDWNLKELTTIPFDTPPLKVDWRGLEGFFGTKDGLVLLYDLNWQLLLKPIYDQIEDANQNDDFSFSISPVKRMIAHTGDKIIYLDKSFHPITEAFERGEVVSVNDFCIIFRKNEKFGAFNILGQHRLAPNYDYIQHLNIEGVPLFQNTFFVGINGRFGILDSSGTTLVPLVFRVITSSSRKDCNPFRIEGVVDSMDGKWFFINALGVFKAFPDSILSAQAYGPECIVRTAKHEYWVDIMDGSLQPRTITKRINTNKTVERLRAQWDQFEKPPYQSSNVEFVSNKLIHVVKHTPNGQYDQEALLDTNGNMVLDRLNTVVCNGRDLDYVQDGFYRQWGVPLMGKYRLSGQGVSKKQGEFIETYTCALQDTRVLAQGIFRQDGTCILPAKCDQVIEFDYDKRLYFVYFKERQDIFDAEKGIFLPHLLRFGPYFENADRHYYSRTPQGFIWLESEGRSLGLVRISDGVPFFKED
jgi:hypothetical protein